MVPVESGEVLKEPSEDGERRRELEVENIDNAQDLAHVGGVSVRW